MSAHREVPPSSRTDFASLEPGVRAARDRLKLTQEQVAARMNMSIHTFRRWDQGKNRPARLEEMQLLALILETPIEVLWPAERDPLVAEALRLERQRAEPPPEQRPTGPVLPDATNGDTEIRVRRLEKAHVGAPRDARETRPVNLAPDAEHREPAGSPGDLPPWPDELDDAVQDDGPSVDAGAGLGLREPSGRVRGAAGTRVPQQERAVAGPGGATTLHEARPASGRRVGRVIVALGAALTLGGLGAIAASALGERAGDVDPPVQATPEQSAEREQIETRARDVAAMRAAAERGDYDAAIVQARRVGDAAAASTYRASAGRVLVGRADKAARRGDLPLARSRLRATRERYGSVPGAAAVQARVRHIERQREERAQRQRAAARRAAAAAAAQRAAANPVRSSAPSSSSTASPATSDTAPSSTGSSGPSSSSSAKRSGGEAKNTEKTVDPGLF